MKLWQIVAISTIFCLRKSYSVPEQSEDETESIKHLVKRESVTPKDTWLNSKRCQEYNSYCTDGTCIPFNAVCDGFKDCPNGDDERPYMCKNNECSAEKFRCASGACFDKKYVCDGITHCIFGGDDEKSDHCKNIGIPTPKINSATSCRLPAETTHQNFTVNCPNTANCPQKAGEQVPAFTQIEVECKAGYQLGGGSTSTSSCFHGSWKPPIPHCEQTCVLAKNPDMNLRCSQKIGGLPIPCDDHMAVNSIVYPTCKSYFHKDRQIDYTFIRCQSNGQWDRQLFQCIADCGRAQGSATDLISLGKPEHRGDSPWHVAIYDISNPREITLICGGTIVTPQIIVSAAHCFYDFSLNRYFSPSVFEVVVAKYTIAYNVTDNRDTKVYKIRKIFTPDIVTFTGESTNYLADIALLWIKERIEFSSGVLPACVDWTQTTRFVVPDGTQGKLVGWGLTEKDEPSRILLATLLPYVNYKNCREMVNPDFNIGADKFCAGSKTGSGARQGDSGGGLLFRTSSTQGSLYYLRGIVSNKDNSIGENRSSIATFTDIAQYAAWMYERRIEIENEELLAETKVELKT